MWKRRPAAEPDAPPKASARCSSDRIGTGLLVAGVFGVLAAGLAARPTVVAETEATRGGRPGGPRATCRPAATPSSSATRRRRTPCGWRTGYFRTCIASDDRAELRLLLRGHERGPDPDRARPEREARIDPESPPLGQTPSVRRPQPATPGPRPAPPRAAGAGCAPGAAPARGRSARTARSRRPRRWKLRPTARTRPFTATARSRSAPGRLPSSRPITRVGTIGPRGSTRFSRPAFTSTPCTWPERSARPDPVAQQLAVRADPVGHCPRVPEGTLALARPCRTCARASGSAPPAAAPTPRARPTRAG